MKRIIFLTKYKHRSDSFLKHHYIIKIMWECPIINIWLKWIRIIAIVIHFDVDDNPFEYTRTIVHQQFPEVVTGWYSNGNHNISRILNSMYLMTMFSSHDVAVSFIEYTDDGRHNIFDADKHFFDDY